ncbi:MAG: hypothetical protein M1364_00050 [Candidatus Marsarchaeota archaeon]|nr:hypothetical protein [Candidatus Marsarchaeota archaeon]
MTTKDSKAIEYNRMLKDGFFSLAAYTAKENGLDREKVAYAAQKAYEAEISFINYKDTEQVYKGYSNAAYLASEYGMDYEAYVKPAAINAFLWARKAGNEIATDWLKRTYKLSDKDIAKGKPEASIGVINLRDEGAD